MSTGVGQGRCGDALSRGCTLGMSATAAATYTHILCWPSQSSVDRETASRILLKASVLASTQLGGFRIELI